MMTKDNHSNIGLCRAMGESRMRCCCHPAKNSTITILDWRYLLVAVALLLVTAGKPILGADEGVSQPEAILFEDLPVVEAATLHTQTLTEAPANVTIITQDEIRTYGYRTLAEALSNVRGLHTSHDGFGETIGVRGFSLLGDFGTRLLLMLNGHNLSTNTHDSNTFGQILPIDMALIKRIEVIRGPSSALYGSNGVFATVNIVTRSPVDQPLARVSAEMGSLGERRAQVSSSSYLGDGANLLISGSLFNDRGRSVFFDEMNSPSDSFATADGVGKEKGYQFFSQAIWRNWSFTSALGEGEVRIPTGVFFSRFNDPDNRVVLHRSFVEAAYTRALNHEREFRWRVFYDHSGAQVRTNRAFESFFFDDHILIGGDWIGSQVTYTLGRSPLGPLTIGGELNIDLRASQKEFTTTPQFFQIGDIQKPDLSYAAFLQQEWRMSPRWTAYLGARFDDSRHHSAFVSPRAAFIFQQSPKTTYKFLYGRSFRDPNVFEQFFEAPSVRANPSLGPESANTAEVSVEQRWNKRLSGSLSVYQYWMDDLIQNILQTGELFQSRNAGRITASGVEAEINARPTPWLEAGGALAVRRIDASQFPLAGVNSPKTISQLRVATPLGTPKLRLGGIYRYLSSRQTVTGGHVGAASVLDVTLSSVSLHRNFDLTVGARNLFNKRYYDPIGAESLSDRLQQRGRTAFVRLIWHYSE